MDSSSYFILAVSCLSVHQAYRRTIHVWKLPKNCWKVKKNSNKSCTVPKSKYSNKYLRAVCGVTVSNRYKSVRQCRAVTNRAEKE